MKRGIDKKRTSHIKAIVRAYNKNINLLMDLDNKK